MINHIFSCELCETEAHLVMVEGRPERVQCPVCGRAHPFDQLYTVVKELAVKLIGQKVKKFLRTGRHRQSNVRKIAHGFIVELKP